MYHSSITLLPTKRFNENNIKINITLINFIKLLIENKKNQMGEEEKAHKVKTSKNGEEVDEGRGGGEPRLAMVVEGSKRSLAAVYGLHNAA